VSQTTQVVNSINGKKVDEGVFQQLIDDCKSTRRRIMLCMECCVRQNNSKFDTTKYYFNDKQYELIVTDSDLLLLLFSDFDDINQLFGLTITIDQLWLLIWI
jgi:predicted oxidoreductase